MTTYRLAACKAVSEGSLAKIDATSTHEITYVDERGDVVYLEDEELRAISKELNERSCMDI